jgi:two-component system phosphate regulon sensor histidine kinase PhoR
MKKVFPLIIVLITISLFGIIIIQVSWIRSYASNLESSYEDRLRLIIQDVGEQLVSKMDKTPLNLQEDPLDLGKNSDLGDLRIGISASSYFSVFEIKEIFRKSFEKAKIKNVEFEFAVESYGIDHRYSLKSPGFLKLDNDTIHNVRIWYPLIPKGGSLRENLIVDEALVMVIPNLKSVILRDLDGMIAISIIFTLIIITAFYLTVGTLVRQKKLSEMKTDFINNMTHELKTPLATISLAIDALRTEKVRNDNQRFQYFTGIIKDENQRMNKHVETILQASLMEKREVKLDKKELHLHDIIRKVISNLQLQIEENKGKVALNLQAADDLMLADEVHITNVINNLVDNAIKYSKPDSIYISITTKNYGRSGIRLQIEDHGIGMNKETLSRVFEKFYRAHTGNVHNVKGFGLGLSYVKAMTEAHGGKIKADSMLGKGSTFVLSLPLHKGGNSN